VKLADVKAASPRRYRDRRDRYERSSFRWQSDER